jgi:hypothetical protein
MECVRERLVAGGKMVLAVRRGRASAVPPQRWDKQKKAGPTGNPPREKCLTPKGVSYNTEFTGSESR